MQQTWMKRGWPVRSHSVSAKGGGCPAITAKMSGTELSPARGLMKVARQELPGKRGETARVPQGTAEVIYRHRWVADPFRRSSLLVFELRRKGVYDGPSDVFIPRTAKHTIKLQVAHTISPSTQHP